MGVPKFYRWTSERYPCLSEVVKEYQIPKFDNLYLDMNGIIHTCSHPNDDDPHFRISEQEIFHDIFHYIEVLFRMIQPTQVFYLAVDGVAPRAKMNQQRGRRFRSAREAKENEKKALEKGEVLPTEARFDSNCITPGTEFMTKLDAQLQYFIKSKVSSDNLWQNCSIIYSSHKTPGEGEHKIMEYIRYSRSQPGYNPHTKHCLYGLDADLIMLGLTSHEPYFALLREEIKFGRKKGSSEKRMSTPEQITFHLLHLSLLRDYIDLEFHELHDTLPFPYDLEAIIDDWVLMGFLMGNDFIPHLPGLHINKDSLSLLYKMYKQVLPTLDGYLNEHGHLHLGRMEKFMTKLTEFDEEAFHDLSDNLKYLAGKRSAAKADERADQLEPFFFDESDSFGNFDTLEGGLEDGPITQKDAHETLTRLDLGQHLNDFAEEDQESSPASEDDDELFREEFRQHKRDYYITKMLFKEVTPDVLRDQAANYVRGIQWILHYYYTGICSWSWYYPYHYAPYISDVRDFANIDIFFDKGTPFFPFEQLLAVLPPLSANFLPKPYQHLMLSPNSPLKEFYPIDFDTDLNGKLQNWEAVVLIPFINESQLLEAMESHTGQLTSADKERNTHGPIFIYRFTPDSLGELKAPAFFPSIVNHASVELVWREEWEMDPSDMFKGLLPSALSSVLYTGFPTLKFIEHTFRLESCAVRVFQQDSRGDSFILEVKPQPIDMQDLLKRVVGNVVYLPWPHLLEAKVVAISSQESRFYLKGADDDPPHHEALDERQMAFWRAQSEDLKSTYMKRWGIDLGDIEFIVYAKQLSGRTYTVGLDGNMTLKKSWSQLDQPYPLQLTVWDVEAFHQNLIKYKSVKEFFTPSTKVFMLGNPNYGFMGEVLEYDSECKDRVPVSLIVPVEPKLQRISTEMKEDELYFTASECAVRLSISSQLFARLTGDIFMAKALELNPFIKAENASNKLNIGLNLKSTKRSEEVIGFSRRDLSTNQWLYSIRCIECMKEYISKFPEVFEFLSRNSSRNDIFQDEPFPKNYEVRVPELVEWLKSAPFAQAERQKWGTTLLSPSIVEEILKEVKFAASQRARSVKLNIKPHLLFKPNSMQGNTPPDPSVSFAMFDRIINVREGFSVPLGAIGTIVGIQSESDEGLKIHKKKLPLSEKLFTILFDEPFSNGLTLVGSASAHCCYRLMSAHMINISHGQRLIRNQEVTIPSRIRLPAVQNAILPMPIDPVPNNTRFSTSPSNRDSQHNLEAMKNIPSQASAPPKVDASDLFPLCSPTSASNKNSVEEPKVGKAPPEPPKPSQLPKPLLFTATSSDKPLFTQSTNSPFGQGPVHEIKSERDVTLVIHGDFYENWDSILTDGLRPIHGQYIPCLSYVPPLTRDLDSSHSYELHIYLNIAKLLRNGIRIFQLQNGQILCSTNQNVLVPPCYFDKVIDVASKKTIFSNTQTFNDVPKYSSAPSFQMDSPKGRGRGSQPPSPFGHLFDNIWLQVQNANTLDPGSLKPEYLGHRKEIPLNELFNLTSPGKWDGCPPRCNPPLYLAPVPLIPPINSIPHHTDLHSYTNISNAYNFAPPTPSYNYQQSVLMSPGRNHGNSASEQFTAFDPRTHLRNSCGDKTSFSNCPNKTKFVPTQVSRKQTLRKLFSSGHQNNQVPNFTKGVPSYTSFDVSDRMPETTMCDPRPESFKEMKPRRKHRSRIAANFDFVNPVRPDNV